MKLRRQLLHVRKKGSVVAPHTLHGGKATNLHLLTCFPLLVVEDFTVFRTYAVVFSSISVKFKSYWREKVWPKLFPSILQLYSHFFPLLYICLVPKWEATYTWANNPDFGGLMLTFQGSTSLLRVLVLSGKQSWAWQIFLCVPHGNLSSNEWIIAKVIDSH
jgi:hypothetical protein